jgi:uncharacterized protein (DUF1697 family)
VRYVAFLRGVNVGGRTIKMAELRACVEALGFEQVTTVTQAGNLLFDATGSTAAVRRTLEDGLKEAFGYPAIALVMTPAKVAKIVEGNPFDTRDGTCHVYCVLLDGGHERALVEAAGALDDELEAAKAGSGVVYWRVVKGNTLKTPFSKQLSAKAYRDVNTNRNINTLQKILELGDKA